MEEFQKALAAWAEKYAELFVQHGLPEGEKPSRWCNDVMLDSIVEDSGMMDALQKAAEAAFLAACKKRGL